MYCTALFCDCDHPAHAFPRAVGSGDVLARIAEGLALVRTDKRLIGVLVVTVIYNIFGWPFTGMISGHRARPSVSGPGGAWACWRPWTGSALFVGRAAGGAVADPRDGTAGLILAVSSVTWSWWWFFGLVQSPALGGRGIAADGVWVAPDFATMQATLVYLASPPEMRSAHSGRPHRLHRHRPDRLPVVWGWLADRIGGPPRHGRDRRSRASGDGRDPGAGGRKFEGKKTYSAVCLRSSAMSFAAELRSL